MEMIQHDVLKSRYNRFYSQERSLTLLLIAAVKRLYPEYDIVVQCRFAGGMYCTSYRNDPNGNHRIALDYVAVEREMHAIVDAENQIEIVEWSKEKTLEYLQEHDAHGAKRLIERLTVDTVRLWQLSGSTVWFPGELELDIHSIGNFGLEPFAEGFVLRLPDRKDSSRLAPFKPSDRLFSALMQTKDWGVRTRVYDIGTLNIQIENDPTGLILTSEALHEQHLTDVTRELVSKMPETRVVLIAGPSSSGKTTFSRRLAIQLRAQAIHSIPVQLDDYFRNRTYCPKDEFGNYDFEHFDCVDREMLNKDVALLLSGEKVTLPKFDFITGQSQRTGNSVQLRENEVLILEGIHGLNPSLLTEIQAGHIARIFVSELTNLNIDVHSRIPTSDIRLIRRLVRDYRTRGHTPQSTLSRWESVRRGEDRWIFPYQDNADMLFNSALPYEIASMKARALRLLGMVDYTGMGEEHGNRIRSMLELVLPIEPKAIPLDSVIREFIGGGVWE